MWAHGLWQQVEGLVVFEDPKETGQVIELLLNLAAHGTPLPLPGTRWHARVLRPHELDAYVKLLAFLQKHGCFNAILAFGRHIVTLMALGVLASHVGFALGLLAGDRDVCAASLAFRGREALPAFLGSRAWDEDNVLLRALDHVEELVNGRGQCQEGCTVGSERHFPDGSDDFINPDDENDIVNWGYRRDLKEQHVDRQLARRFLSFVGTSCLGPFARSADASSWDRTE